MVRAVAMSAASALCLIWAAGCAGTSDSASKTASTLPAAQTADNAVDANADPAALGKAMPNTLDGEIKRAQMLRAKGDYDEAARSFAQIMLVAPDDARAVGGYGKVLEQQGHSQQALQFLKHAVEINSHDWSLQSALGIAYDQLDDHTNARAAYERALALKPGEASVLNNYAVSRMLAGDYATAKKLLAQAEAGGVSNPKLALNLEKLASLDVAPATVASAPPKPVVEAKVQPTAATPIKTNTVAVASLGTPAASSASVKLSPKATVAVAAPVAKKSPAAANATRVATSAPKLLASGVVMQAVPKDPLAGPVKHREHPVQKLASAAHPSTKPSAPKATAAAAPPPPPALRTAADGD